MLRESPLWSRIVASTGSPAKHARNSHFEWRQAGITPRRISAVQAMQYREQGFFLFEDAFSGEELAAVITAIAPLEEQTESFLQTRRNGTYGIARANQITFSPHLVTRSEVLREFSKHPVLVDLVHDLIGPPARLYWDQAVYKKPGNPEEFPWHQDNGYTYVEPQQYLTCWIPLTDATQANGCPWVVPGLHRLGTLEHHMTPLGWQCLENPANAVMVEAKAGSIVVFSSLTPHRTGPNLTDSIRKAYILQYAPDGAVAHPATGEPTMCSAEDRQYRVC
jgi:ectoine hydroxylase-related dioxygenase (phytanoyl-CoA dioxygenase family)